jgi:hypothetical protein
VTHTIADGTLVFYNCGFGLITRVNLTRRIIRPLREYGVALALGTRHGGYEILALIGSGGMGEVYRVRDSKLGCERSRSCVEEFKLRVPVP